MQVMKTLTDTKKKDTRLSEARELPELNDALITILVDKQRKYVEQVRSHIYLSTNLYVSLCFGTKDAALPRWLF